MPTSASASVKATVEPTGTSRPAARSDRTNATAARSGSTADRVGDQFAEPLAPQSLLVFAVLHDRAQRCRHGVFGELVAAEGGERERPVDGFGHPGRLVETALAHGGGRRRHLLREALAHTGYAGAHDGDLALEVGMLDPVV